MELIQINIRAESSPETQQILQGINHLLRGLHEQREVIDKMSTTAVTREQFDAGLDALLQAEAARDAAVTQALNDLIAKVNAGTVPPEDFAGEMGKVLALQTAAAALTQAATADDPGPTTITPPAPTT